MSQLRLNPLTGRWVTIAAERAARPADLSAWRLPVEAGPRRPCPFCPGNEEATLPALETYGAHGGWLIRVVPNRYPAFFGDEALHARRLGPVFTQAPATGVHEVLVFSPNHAGSWADLDDKHAGLVMAAVRDRMEDLSRRSAVQYTQTIVNHGREAGASLEHPHGQILGIPFVPGELADECAGFGDAAVPCLLCTAAEEESDAGHRVVVDDERVLVVCPFWSGVPYELLVVPKAHTEHLHHASPHDLVAVGRSIRTALGRLRSTVGDVAYNIVFHTAPREFAGPFHWHVHVFPRVTSIAGFEQGTGVLINIVAPEQAATTLRGDR